MNRNFFSNRCFLALWLLCVFISAFASGRAAHAQAFPNDGRFYQVRQITSGGSDVSQLYVLNRNVSPYAATPVGTSSPAGVVLNALAFNEDDRFIYAMQLTSNRLYRLSQAGPSAIGTVTGLPSASYNSGAIDNNGTNRNYYIATLTTSTIYRINNINAATAGTGGTAAGISLTTIPLSQQINTGDFAVNPLDGKLYAVSAQSNPPVLSVIDITSAAATKPVTQITTSGIPNANATIGSVFFDTAGKLYAYSNNGVFYSINITTGAATQLSTAPTTSQSDGASNAYFNIPFSLTKTVTHIARPNPTTYDITFSVSLRNDSVSSPASNVQLTENLDRAFTSGSPTLSILTPPAYDGGVNLPVNAAFTGRQAGDTRLLIGNGILGAGQTTTVTFTVRAVYPNAASVPAQESNTIYASSTGTVNAQGVNAGWTFPNNVPVPPPDLIGSEVSDPAPINFRTISGRVFEDVNYGGGAGRPFGTAGTVGVPVGTRVELYSVSGTTATALAATTTGTGGTYTFADLPPGEYLVRVPNANIVSTRPTTGAAATPVAVQTFRTTGNVPDGAQVGGNAPTLTDAGNGGTGTTINTTNGAISGGGVTGTVAQTIGRVTLGTADAANVDFGFNFDTIVNTNNTGQGSLRQFIINSNRLANTGLAQAGQTSGVENTIFMIPAAQLTGGVARITIATTDLPTITDGFTAINGATQTSGIGNTNTAILGVGGTVGVGNIALGQVAGPEVEIVDGDGRAVGLSVNANDVTVRNLAIYGFGNAVNSNANANILVGDVLRTLIENSVVGTTATAFSDPGAARSGGDSIRSVGGDSGIIRNNLIGFSAGKGIALEVSSTAWNVTNNEVRGNGIGNPDLDGLDLENAGSGNSVVSGNLFIDNSGGGVDTSQGGGGNTIVNNTITGNGRGVGTGPETAGVRLYSSNNTVDRNLIFGNGGAGILVTPGVQNNLITQNSIYANGSRTSPEQIGIDLLETGQDVKTGTPVAGRGYVTPNDLNDADTGANGLLNFPVFESALIDSATNTVVLKGWARPGATVEIFVAAPDASGFGEGQTYLQTRVEGSPQDADATTSTYVGSALNPSQPNVGTDNTNRFEFRIPLLSVGSILTATATIGQNTSEFSNNVTVSNAAAALTRLSGTVYLDANANANANRDSGEQGTGEAGLFIKAVPLDNSGNPTGPALAAASVDPATGNYFFTGLNAGRYRLVLDDNGTLTDVTPLNVGTRGYIGTEAITGAREAIITAAPNQTPENGAQNFGLFRGARVVGNVFTDNGLGGGSSANGAREGGEIGIAGVTVNAQNAGNAIVATAQSDANGNYVLFVPAGPIRIAEINAPGFVSTGASVGNSGGTYTRGTDSIVFTATAGTAYAELNFGDIQSPTFTNDNVQVLAPGASTFFPHVFTAYAPGTVGFLANGTSAPAGLNFTRIIVRDTNGNGVLDGTENTGGALSSVTITQAEIDAGGGSAQIFVLIQEFAPANAAPGAQDTVGIRATYDPTENGVAPLANVLLTRQDIAKVQQSGDLQLFKTVDLATARPGDNVIYTIRFRNAGNNPLTQLVVADKVPAFTTYQSQTVGALPAGLTAPTFTGPAAPQSGVFNWTFGGALNPGAEGTVTFTVRVNN